VTASEACAGCAATRRAAAEAALLARCSGCGETWIPEADGPAPQHAPDVEGDCEALARWLGVLSARATRYEPVVRGGGGAHTGRPDAIDEAHRGLRRAIATLGRLNALARTHQGFEADVLWYAFVVCGPEKIRTHAGGREDLVADRFAPKPLKTFWHNHKSAVVRREECWNWGNTVLIRAQAAYLALVGRTEPARAGTAVRLARELARRLEAG
jgi:hypothetical protein